MRTLNANWSSHFQVTQNENEQITYTINWAGVLDTDTISASTWTALDDGLTIANKSNTTTTTTCRMSTTSAGKYTAVNKITTASSDILEQIIIIQVADNDNSFFNDYV